MDKFFSEFAKRVTKLNEKLQAIDTQFPGSIDALERHMEERHELIYCEEPMRFIDYCNRVYTIKVVGKGKKARLMLEHMHDEEPLYWDPKLKVFEVDDVD